MIALLALAACGDKPDPAETGTCDDACGDTGTPDTDDTGDTHESTPPDDSGDTDSGDTGPAEIDCATPVAVFELTDGTQQDVTDAFLTGTYLTLDQPGTLYVCPRTWYSRVLVRADVDVVGLGATPADTVLSGGESGTILDVSGAEVSLSVSNVTLDRGAGLDEDHNSGGGGIYCQDYGTVSVADAVFSNNFANDGSGLYATDCDVTVADSTFVDNLSEDDGGAFTLWFSTATIDGVTFADNVGLDGGAIALFYSTADFTGTTVRDNEAGGFAGGIWVYESTISMADSTVSGNVDDTQYAGGVLVYGEATFDAVAFTDNVAPQGGGVFVYWESVVEGTACDFSGNTPDDIFVADYSDAGGVSMAAGSGYSFSCAANVCTQH